jgi:FtsP/CotA-like multicopper oxidase with cupredoxin domain
VSQAAGENQHGAGSFSDRIAGVNPLRWRGKFSAEQSMVSSISPSISRREMLALLGGGLSSAALGAGQSPDPQSASKADITLRIQELTLELAPRRLVKTVAYNGQVPGPLLRVQEGKTIAVDVINDTRRDEIVHWHGLYIPAEVDGSLEEGTPPVPRNGHRRYVFTPRPAGTRWYHSHIQSGRDLQTGTYTGQFGMLIIEGRDDPGRSGDYDLEVPVLLHEWEPSFTRQGPLSIEYKLYSVNGHMLGFGEPVRVQAGQRALFRIVNASATEPHRLSLAGHAFQVLALDGNRLAQPRTVSTLELGPGERIDAIVEMNNAGVWILGETHDQQRSAGMGMVIEYGGAQGAPRWLPPSLDWDYRVFGGSSSVAEPEVAEPDVRSRLVFRQPEGSHRFTINGKSYPDTQPVRVEQGRRYRLLLDNQSADAHPIHLHRHTFEITRFDQKATAGVFKDVVMVPAWKQVEIDFVADNPGPSLFHCHNQFHMDSGFMVMVEYAG